MRSLPKIQTVVVLGASPKPERYSNKAVRLLLEHGHTVLPVHPAVDEIEGLPVFSDIPSIGKSVDTVALYLSAKLSSSLTDDLIALKPARVIFNPGTENAELHTKLAEVGIATEEACTLVLLHSGQF